MPDFQDKVVIITGGGAGIGLAAAKMFADEGAKILITGRRGDALEKIAATNPNIAGFVADASNPASAGAAVARAIDLWGRLDVVVNNAGDGAVGPMELVSPERIAQIFAVNVIYPGAVSAAALPYLEASQGLIVNLSSTYGSKAGAPLSYYAASKAAVEHLTRCWALEFAAKRIRVNAIASGPVETTFMNKQMGLPDEVIDAIKAHELGVIPLGRRGVPDDVAAWIVTLARPELRWVTGQVIAVDGGLQVT